MPGFPDKFMPFMDEPPGGKLSSTAISAYGAVIRRLRKITSHTLNEEPKWRHNGPTLTTGYGEGVNMGTSTSGKLPNN
jgi:hydrogenase small subunit